MDPDAPKCYSPSVIRVRPGENEHATPPFTVRSKTTTEAASIAVTKIHSMATKTMTEAASKTTTEAASVAAVTRNHTHQQNVKNATPPSTMAAATTTEVASKTATEAGPSVAIIKNHLPQQDLFDPFVSLTLSEVKIATCAEGIWNFYQVSKRFFKLVTGLLHLDGIIILYVLVILALFIFRIMNSSADVYKEFVPLILLLVALFFLLLGLLDILLSMWFALMVDPMEILVEARASSGALTHFMIRDMRSRMARFLNWRAGSRMELSRLEDNTPLLETTAEMFGSSWICCCICFYTRKINLKRVRDDVTLATYDPYKCCGSCDCNWCQEVTSIHQSDYGRVEFVRPLYQCGNRANVISPSEKLQPYQLAVQKRGLSCCDFFLGAVDLAGDVDLDDAFEDIEDVARNVKAAKDFKGIRDDYKDALSDLKEKGYKKLGTSRSTWDVNFPPHWSSAQKSAAVLFVIKQFTSVLP